MHDIEMLVNLAIGIAILVTWYAFEWHKDRNGSVDD